VDVAHPLGVVVVEEAHHEVGGPVVRLPPRRPDQVGEGALDLRLAGEIPERRADLPNRVLVPDIEETVEIPFIHAVAVIRHQIADREPAFDPVETPFDRQFRSGHGLLPTSPNQWPIARAGRTEGTCRPYGMEWRGGMARTIPRNSRPGSTVAGRPGTGPRARGRGPAEGGEQPAVHGHDRTGHVGGARDPADHLGDL